MLDNVARVAYACLSPRTHPEVLAEWSEALGYEAVTFSALDRDNQNRLEQAIAAHRAAGGRIALATHLPIEVDAAVGIELDAFAPRHSAAAAV